MPPIEEGQGERRRVADVERLIRWYFAPDDSLQALWVAWKCSNMDATAYHRDGTAGVGLFAIAASEVGLAITDEQYLVNPIRNVAYAHRLFLRYGWKYWDVGPIPPLWGEELERYKPEE
jgi:hypothetical protein